MNLMLAAYGIVRHTMAVLRSRPGSIAAAVATAVLFALTVGCAQPTVAAPDWRTDPSEPYPFVTPLPPAIATAIDGLYDREPTDTFEGEWAKCRRCPPYFVDAGRSQLTFRLGRWSNTHQDPRQVTDGHFTLAGDRLILTNDPMCPFDRGEYRFTLANGVLTLEAIEDPCAFGERKRDLTERTWQRLGDAPGPTPRSTAGPGPTATSAEYLSQ